MYNLLVADDEYEIRTGLCTYFPWNEVGFEVVGQAENGMQALEFLQRNEVHVLLCDIRMPVMTGIDLARELHRRKSRTRVIFLSGYREFEYAQTALSLGVKSYIVKSTKTNELMNVFRSLRDELDMEYGKIQPPDRMAAADAAEDGGYYDRIISIIKQYVEEHYMDAELENAAALVHMNQNYVSRLFKQKTGQNFSDYVLACKMKKAVELLKDPRNRTYEVSEMLGYSNVKNFTRAFRNYYGRSPRAFRTNEGLSAAAEVSDPHEKPVLP